MKKQTIDSREEELRKRNAQLERKKRELQEELNNMKITQDYLNFENADHRMPQQPEEDTQKKNTDIISEIEAVNRIQAERNAARLKELKEEHAKNIKKIADQKHKITTLQNNMEQGERALDLKSQAVAELQNKGKKISEESKKWISEITKLTEKSEQLRYRSSALNKEVESLSQQLVTSQKNQKLSQNQHRQLQQQDSHLANKITSLTEELQSVKEHIKENSQASNAQIEAIKKHNDKIRLNQKRMERQKTELIKAFRKLNNYIQLLRKQNLHVQTARSLNFSMEEFLQAVDKNDRM